MFLMCIANFIISSNSSLLEQADLQLIGIQQRTILAFISYFFSSLVILIDTNVQS